MVTAGISILVRRHVHESETCAAGQLQPWNGLSTPAFLWSQRTAAVGIMPPTLLYCMLRLCVQRLSRTS